MNDLGGPPRLLLQYADLLASRVRSLAVLQKFADPQNAGQRIVEFVGNPADHRAHSSQPLALHDLLLQLLLHRDVAHRDDHAANLSIGVKELAGRGPHGTPAAIAVPRPVFCRAKNPDAGRHVAVERREFRRVVLGFGNLLSHQILGLISQQVAHSRTHKRVSLLQIDYKNQVGEALQQTQPEFFLPQQLPFQFAPFCDVDQRALVTNQFARSIPNGTR